MQRNGLRVLARFPGLMEHLNCFVIDQWQAWSVLKEDPGLLGISDHPKRFREDGGLGMMAISRPKMQKRLVDFAQKHGVPIFWGHKLEDLEQTAESVTVTFANGVKETFSFVIGCDGIHSNTRTCLFGVQPATYTGLSQVNRTVRCNFTWALTSLVTVGRCIANA